MIKEKTLEQFKLEIDTWSRLVSYFQQENAYLKDRLADIVNLSYENDQLLNAENFLEEFILQDKMISFFADELKLQFRLIQNCYDAGQQMLMQVNENQQRLRVDFIKAEQCFFRVKDNFAEFGKKMIG